MNDMVVFVILAFVATHGMLLNNREKSLIAFRDVVVMEYAADGLLALWRTRRAQKENRRKACGSQLQALVVEICNRCILARNIGSVDELYRRCCGEDMDNNYPEDPGETKRHTISEDARVVILAIFEVLDDFGAQDEAIAEDTSLNDLLDDLYNRLHEAGLDGTRFSQAVFAILRILRDLL
ncbi:hypothetical protein QR680_008353 [Steinernema hermaphroditum]|uniref:Uncharacterized protein n=2 Tax=Steinernema hermaphroditum TaxID=289476 RepID=A0AA39M7Y3_9BILA|nr:hypothetical protein QR680_008353 [Steinernema hermaphroditum]